MARETCLLDDKELINIILRLQKDLSHDFLENKLQECNICKQKIDANLRRHIHQKLIEVYNNLSDIKKNLPQRL